MIWNRDGIDGELPASVSWRATAPIISGVHILKDQCRASGHLGLPSGNIHNDVMETHGHRNL